MPEKKFPVSKGFHGFETDDEAFLKPDPDNWNPSASKHGYNAKFDDDYGWKRGNLGFTDEGGDGAVFNKLADEHQEVAHQRLSALIDSADDMGSGNKLIGGGEMVTPHWLKFLEPTNWEIKSKPGNDKTGVKRGQKGYGEPTAMDTEFLKKDFNFKTQVRETYVGYYNKVTSNDKGDDA